MRADAARSGCPVFRTSPNWNARHRRWQHRQPDSRPTGASHLANGFVCGGQALSVNAIPAGKKDRLPAALWALALCLLGFGTGESVVPGLLLKIASDLKVSTSSAGLLVSGYAIGVVVGHF
jgi:hypothetical protein